MKRILMVTMLLISTLAAQAQYKTSMMEGCVLDGKASFEDKCKVVKAAGFDAIQVNSHQDRDMVVSMLKKYDLEISSICCSTHWEISASSADAKERADAAKNLKIAIEDAAYYGTDAVLFVPGRVSESCSYDECWDRSTEVVKSVVPYAKKMGVVIAIENVWNDFLLSPLEAARYVDQFKSKYVGFFFDAGNIAQIGWPDQWIKILGDRMTRLHIKEFDLDKSGSQGKWKGFDAALGDGSVNWAAVMAAVKEVGYDSYITVEMSCSDAASLVDMKQRLDKNVLAH